MKFRTWKVLIFCLIASLSSAVSFAGIGKVIIAKGETFAIDAASNSRPLTRRSDILEGDTLITGSDSEIHIRFVDNAVLALRADSQLKINEYHANASGEPEQVLMELLSGGFRTISGSFGKSDRDAYQIRTPNASIGIRGTNYEAVLDNNALLVGVYEGGVRLQNQFGSINLGLDSAFSFAQVNGPTADFQGLLEAPSQLSQPLTTSFNAAPTQTEGTGEDETANLQNDDDALLVDNLFSDESAPLQTKTDTLAQPTPTKTTGIIEPAKSTQTIDKIIASNNLTALQDVRLSQEQIKLLKNGAGVGFVVVNENPEGYRVANYQMSFAFSSISTLGSTVSFDIKHGNSTYNITLTGSSVSSASSLAADINTQISSQAGMINETSVPPLVVATFDSASGTLVFQGFADASNSAIVFENFTGAATEPTDVAAAMGLCDNATIACSGRYDLGALSSGNYESAVHFGYMVPGKNGPVFVNFKNESITALADGYKTPDHVLRGNANATLTEFAAVDTNAGAAGEPSNVVKWGYWDTSATNPAILLKDAKNLNVSETIESPYFYVVAPPAKSADLVGEKTLSSVVDWHGTSTTSPGMHNYEEGISCNDSASSCLTASLSVNFATADATGSLEFSNSMENWYWQLQYYGKVKGAQFFSDYGYGSLYNQQDTYDAVGHVDGLFSGNSTNLGFVGGFGLQTTDDSHSSQGVFIIK